jgi:phosphatidylethanolamine/phosphatidyl-N-methylethanolamine N-methyltransferase
MVVNRLRNEARAEAKRIGGIVADEVRFIRTWASKPLTTGAVSPSGRALARAMAGQVDPSWPGVVVELGPGTGAVTAAILERGIDPHRLVAIEYNADFAGHLRQRFPGVQVIEGDAYALARTLAVHNVGPVAAVVSSLPLFTRPPLQRRDLLAQATRLLEPGRPFVQFSYALVPPVAEQPGAWSLEVSDWILMNLPPARVWTYRAGQRAS